MTLLLQMLVIVKLFLFDIVLCYAKIGGTPNVLYVTPNPHIPCPGMPCLTFSQYAQDQDTYFRSDTELRLLSGIHRLTRPILIEGGNNITELALVGERMDQSEIVASASGGLRLMGIKSTKIQSLKFSGTNVLTVENSSNLTLSDLQFTAVNEVLLPLKILTELLV